MSNLSCTLIASEQEVVKARIALIRLSRSPGGQSGWFTPVVPWERRKVNQIENLINSHRVGIKMYTSFSKIFLDIGKIHLGDWWWVDRGRLKRELDRIMFNKKHEPPKKKTKRISVFRFRGKNRIVRSCSRFSHTFTEHPSFPLLRKKKITYLNCAFYSWKSHSSKCAYSFSFTVEHTFVPSPMDSFPSPPSFLHANELLCLNPRKEARLFK